MLAGRDSVCGVLRYSGSRSGLVTVSEWVGLWYVYTQYSFTLQVNHSQLHYLTHSYPDRLASLHMDLYRLYCRVYFRPRPAHEVTQNIGIYPSQEYRLSNR